MEQNNLDTANVNKTISNKIPYWNRPSTGIILLIIIVVPILIYFYLWIPRQECTSKIQYNPASKITPEGFYTLGSTLLGGPKFKTKEEAVDYCMSTKNN